MLFISVCLAARSTHSVTHTPLASKLPTVFVTILKPSTAADAK